jgi:Ser/Thr protein kinase RdoA (MazF antagonist)
MDQQRPSTAPSDPAAEIPLPGGVANRGLVVRVGDTVRRPQRRTSPATHALLHHLESSDFEGAPRFLGVDSHNREVLSYISGDTVAPPYPAWVLTDETLGSVAQLLRRYHEVVSTFDPSRYRWPPSPPDPFRGTLVTHNDPNLHNVIFRRGRAIAFIDFDLASPGSAIWDIAAAVRLWSPLRNDDDITDSRRTRALPRFKIFVEAYGLQDYDPADLVRAVQLNHDWLYTLIRTEALTGNAGYVDYWRGAADRVYRTRRWYAANHLRLTEALAADGPI